MSSGRNKQVKELVSAAKDQGWEVEVDGAGHFRMIPPGDGVPISIASTPSDYRTLKNDAARLKRMGLQLPGQRATKRQPGDKLCLASWHGEEESSVGFCDHCRGTWKVLTEEEAADFLVDAAAVDFKIPDEWMNPPTEPEREPVDDGPIKARVLKALQDLKGEYVDTKEMSELTGIEKAKAGAALRSLLGTNGVTRSKRGRYGIPKVIRETQCFTEPEVDSPVGLTDEIEPESSMAEPALTIPPRSQAAPPDPAPPAISTEGPPDPTKAWRWAPGTGWVEDTARATDVALYEGTGLKDKQGRPIVKDEEGDLFVAVPLVMG